MIDFGQLKPPPDYVGNAMFAFNAGRQAAATRQAGNALAQGDQQGAQQAYFSGGMVDQGMALQDRQTQEADRARNVQRQGTQDQYAANAEGRAQGGYNAARQKEQLEATMQQFGILRNVRDSKPQDLGAAIDQVSGVLYQFADTPEERAEAESIIAAVKSDPAMIDRVLGVVEKEYRVIQGPNGALGYTVQAPGAPPAYQELNAPQADPMEDLKRRLIEAQISATTALGGQRGRSNQPRAGGGGNIPPPPTGFVMEK